FKRKFSQDIFFRRLEPHRFSMVHIRHPQDSAERNDFVSWGAAMGRAAEGVIGLLIESEAKTPLGPVQQNAEVLAVHSKFPADLVFILFFQEDSAKQV